MTEPLRVSAPVKAAFGIAILASLVMGVTTFVRAMSGDPGRPDIVDFHVFRIVSQLVWSGRLADAYGAVTLLPLERALSGTDTFMAYSYPPLFALVLAPLAMLPPGVAFLLFVVATLAFYLVALRRLGGEHTWPVLIAMTPSIAINVQSGQNGLLTGGLIGAAALFFLARKPVGAGAAVAAMAIKPHLAVMLPVMLAIDRRWLALALAALGAIALTGASVAIFGPQVFSAFLASLGEVRRLMAAHAYPIHRMPTMFACGLSVGLPAGAAIVVHGLAAIAILAATGLALARAGSLRSKAGLAIMATVFISPYFYDYDQTVFGVGLVLVAPDLVRAMTPRGYGVLLGIVALTQTAGLLQNAFYKAWTGFHVCWTGPVLLACFVVILGAVTRVSSRRDAPSLRVPSLA